MEQIGRYQIVGELGRGAMGVVFRALDPSIGREVAIKTIRLSEFTNAEQRAQQRERLFREARSAGILSIPTSSRSTTWPSRTKPPTSPWSSSPDRRSNSFSTAKAPFEPERVFSILRQTAAGLDYAHLKGIVHRDIKPANIILDESGVAKIADFGIAKISAADQLTQTGLIVGTPNYMSPEQVQGKPVSGFADQYSLTVLAYELLTGDKPFVADQITTLVYQIVCEMPPPAHRLNPTIGPRIESVLQRGLLKTPEQRYPNCTAMVDALEASCAATPGWRSLGRGGSPDLPTMVEVPQIPVARNLPPPRVREEPDARKSRALPILATLILAGALAGAVYYFRQPAAPVTAPAPAPVVEATKPADPVPVAAAPPVETATPPPPQEHATPTPPPSQTPIEVPIRTQPSGATVTLDGSAETACVTPCVLTPPVGDHTLTLALPGFRTTTRTIKVTDPMVELPVFTISQTSGILMLQTEPNGASVTIDGRRWPGTTPTQITLPAGKHRLSLEKGDLKTSQDVEIRDGDLKHLSIPLTQP